MNLKTIEATPADTQSNLFKDAMANLHEIFYCVDSDNRLIYINRYGQKTIKLAGAVGSKTSIFEINPNLSVDRWQMAKKAARDKGQWIIPNLLMRGKDRQFSVEISISYCQLENNDYYYCLVRPINKLEQSDKLLDLIATATASYSGELFFETLMKYMAQVLQVKIAFITECLDQPPSRVRMLAFWSANKIVDNLEYDLAETPCDTVINGKKDLLVSSRLGEIYPKDKGFAESYYGIPIYDRAHSQVLGHIAFLDNDILTSTGLDYTVFEILASRASVELQRMRAESALKDKEEKYRLLVENQTDLIMRLDTQANLQFASPSCVHTLGKSELDLLGGKIAQFIHPDELKIVKKAWCYVLKPPYIQHFEIRTRTTQGWCWFAWSLKGVSSKQGTVTEVVAVGRDISSRRRAEEQTQNTLRQLAHVGRLSSMGEMATGIAHEINQPLTAIMSYAQASRRMYEQNNFDIEQQKAVLERIAVNAELAGGIIKRIRTFSQKNTIRKSSVALPILVEEVIKLFGNEMRNHEIQLSIQLENSLPLILADTIQIQQVLLNLIRNGIDAILNNDQPSREIAIVANTEDSGTYIIIEVQDSGPGISKQLRDHMFSPFFTTKANGLGIGLSICHSIVEAHGGKLKLGSPPKDSVFNTVVQFALPIYKEYKDT